jgi:hypothetical protein
MNLRIGFFEDFGWADSVLLEGTPSDLRCLSEALSGFGASSQPELSIHELAWVAPRHPTRLFASRTGESQHAGFHWLCTPHTLLTILDALSVLAARGPGHQYFDLHDSSAQLIVATGEYGSDWWEAHG